MRRLVRTSLFTLASALLALTGADASAAVAKGDSPQASPSAVALQREVPQHRAALRRDDDSTRRAEERARLEKESGELREQIYTLRDLPDEADSVRRSENSARIAVLEQRLDSLERRLDTLNMPTAEGTDEKWWDEGEWDGDSGDWWDTDEDGQFTPRPEVFRKYPSVFRWFFPVDSRMAESFVRYNRNEGLYLGLSQPRRLYWHSQPKLVSTGSLGYGFSAHRWRYSLGLYLPIYLTDQIVEIGAEGHSLTDSKDQWTIDRDENSLMAFFGKEDFMDYFGREGFSASASWYYRGPEDVSLRASLAYVHDTYQSLVRTTNWSLFGGDKRFREMPPVVDGNINSMVLSAGIGTVPSLSAAMTGWNVTAQYELAGDALKGDVSFRQITIDARRYQPLADFLSFNVRGRVIGSSGSVPAQRMVEFGGPSTLPAYRYKELAGTHGMLVNAELILRGALLGGETRGFISSVLTGINLIVFADAATTSRAAVLSGSGIQPPRLFSDIAFNPWSSDAGVAIGNSDGDFRIGAAWRLDRSGSPALVVRFSRPF